MRVIDTYMHVGLPRFMSAEECLKVMDDNGVEAAMLVAAETCPDLKELSRAAVGWPSRLRAVGMPLGATPQEVIDGIKAQLDSGFVGIRLPAALIAQRPEVLELLGKACAVPYVMGPDVFDEAAGVLADFLERYPQCVAVAPHFAGLPSVESLDESPLAHRLLGQERFLIAFSRHGAHQPANISVVARFLVKAVGWDRLMFGSEYPVCLWRNESYQSTIDWIEQVGLKATEAQRKAFFRGNAEKHLFGYRKRLPTMLDGRWDQMPLKKESPVWLFPPDSIDLPEQTHRTIFLNYLNRGGDKRVPYSRFIAGLLTDAARRMEG